MRATIASSRASIFASRKGMALAVGQRSGFATAESGVDAGLAAGTADIGADVGVGAGGGEAGGRDAIGAAAVCSSSAIVTDEKPVDILISLIPVRSSPTDADAPGHYHPAIAAAGRRANHLRYKVREGSSWHPNSGVVCTARKAGYKHHGGAERASSQKLP
ncbi:hypothetical protein [Sphingomonas sp. T1]|uniref:hypothetical protein n=1 Tax=Sphingomonas sp. T1 TaxID=2653172 RepID=UPI001F39F817|nr:hypothetical protein [Sphingomonas sp. T1]